jgi:uncharacterized protein involved in exopolysaccharide biosynthesis
MATPESRMDLPGFDGGGMEPRRGPTPVDWAMLILWAARQRLALAMLVFLLGMGASVAYLVLRAPVYQVETRVLAQRQQALPSVARGGSFDDLPTRSASEFVHKRENLLALAKATNLLGSPTEVPPERSFLQRILGQPAENPLDALVLRLDKALTVTAGDGVISISVTWGDPQEAYHLVGAALENFLESRHIQEINALDEAISLMQGRLASLRDQLEREESRDASTRATEVPIIPPPGPSVPAPPPQASEELARLKSMLDAKGRMIRDIEEFRGRRLLELQAQLAEKRGVYSDAYPAIINLQKEIADLSRESPQVITLREEEAQLRGEYTARLALESRSASSTSGRPGAGRRIRSTGGAVVESERQKEARAQFHQMQERVNEAQLALDTARAAFKYRYTVVWPAQVPTEPISPRPLRVFAFGGLLSLLIALAAAALPELRSGAIVERWQIERILDLPVLLESTRK